MKRSTLLVSLLSATLATACTDDAAVETDEDAESGGKEDGFGVLVERKLVEETRQPDHVMHDATHVYYILFTEADEAANPQTRSLMRVKKTGGASEKIATLPISFVRYAALGGNDIYLLDGEQLRAIAKTGGTLRTLGAFDSPWALTADATGAYVANQTSEGETYFQRISKVPATGAAPFELARATFVTSMTTDDTHLYWLDETQPNPAIGCGRLAGAAHKIGKHGGVDVTLAAAIHCPLQLVVDATSVYFTNWAMSGPGNPVVKLPKLGGLPRVLGFTGGGELAVDPTHVFYLSTAGGLERTSKTLGFPREVAENVDGGLRADASAVYFWRQTDGTTTYSLFRLGRS